MICESCGSKIGGRIEETAKVLIRNRVNKAKYLI